MCVRVFVCVCMCARVYVCVCTCVYTGFVQDWLACDGSSEEVPGGGGGESTALAHNVPSSA